MKKVTALEKTQRMYHFYLRILYRVIYQVIYQDNLIVPMIKLSIFMKTP